MFQFSERLKKVVTEFYPAGQYGFVIYKPDKSGEMYPLAYRHPVRPHESLFVPTPHEHGHEGPQDRDHYVYYQGRGNQIPADSNRPGDASLPHAVFTAAKNAGKPVPPELDLAKPLSRLARTERTTPTATWKSPRAEPRALRSRGLHHPAACTRQGAVLPFVPFPTRVILSRHWLQAARVAGAP